MSVRYRREALGSALKSGAPAYFPNTQPNGDIPMATVTLFTGRILFVREFTYDRKTHTVTVTRGKRCEVLDGDLIESITTHEA